jgi:hypothetical protein
VPGIVFPVEPSPAASAVTPATGVEPTAAPTQSIQLPTAAPAAAPAGPPTQGQAAQQAGPMAAAETGEAPESPRVIAPSVGSESAPAAARAIAGQAAGAAPEIMDATIQRIVAIAEQSSATARAMVVELPDTDGARLLVSMRGEAVHVTVASPGSGLPGQSWLTELAAALTSRGFVPEGLLADGNGGRRSPYQSQDDSPPARSSNSRSRPARRSGLTL